jgi:hypothetical protein
MENRRPVKLSQRDKSPRKMLAGTMRLVATSIDRGDDDAGDAIREFDFAACAINNCSAPPQG